MTASLNAPVLAPADGGGSNGSGARRRGSRGRGGPSIVARRRPGRAKAEEAAAKNDDQAAEEEKPKPRSRRSSSSRRPSARATKAKAEAAATEAATTEAESPESPDVPAADIAEEPQAAPAEVAPPEVEEPKKPAVRRRTRAAATKSEEPPAALDSGGMNGLLREVASLRSLVEEQHGLMTELRAGLLSLGKQIDYDSTHGNDGSLTITIQALANGFGLEWGESLTIGKRTDSGATAGGTLDYGATIGQTLFGAQAYLHVFAFTGTDATITIQDSASDFSAATLLTFTEVSALGGAGKAERIETASRTETVDRYVRVTTTTSSGFSNLVVAVQVVKNQTSVVF